MLGCQMLAEDLPQLANRVDLDPGAHVYGCRSRAFTYSPHPPRPARFALLGAEAARDLRAAGAERALVYPAALGWASDPPANHTRHVSGTLRMARTRRLRRRPSAACTTPRTVVVCDGSLFPDPRAR